MKRKNIDAMRELRLWIGQVIVPAIGGFVLLRANETTRNWMDDKFEMVKYKLKRFKR